jgi:hypothetical protein
MGLRVGALLRSAEQPFEGRPQRAGGRWLAVLGGEE